MKTLKMSAVLGSLLWVVLLIYIGSTGEYISMGEALLLWPLLIIGILILRKLTLFQSTIEESGEFIGDKVGRKVGEKISKKLTKNQ